MSDTATNFFHFVQAFGSKLKLGDFVNIWMIEDAGSYLCDLLYFSNIFLRQLVQFKEEQQSTKQKTTEQKNNRNFT